MAPPSARERKRISLLIPLYNEEANVTRTLAEIERCIDRSRYDWEIVAVNDGSSDATLAALYAIRSEAFELVIVDLSRNFGKEAALSAGLAHCSGDAVIPLDADLQDPPSLIPQLTARWEEGFDVVLAKRADRCSDAYLKRKTAEAFYSVMNTLSEVKIPENVGDFRLMDQRVVATLAELPETRRFMKGLFAWAGFRTATVEYSRVERAHGKTKFSPWKLCNLAVEGITSFSITPLRICSLVGFLVAIAALFYGSFIVVRTLVMGIDMPGYASLISVMLFTSGLQMIGLGVLGEYVGRIYLESKRRPAYVVRTVRRTGGRVSDIDSSAGAVGSAVGGVQERAHALHEPVVEGVAPARRPGDA